MFWRFLCHGNLLSHSVNGRLLVCPRVVSRSKPTSDDFSSECCFPVCLKLNLRIALLCLIIKRLVFPLSTTISQPYPRFWQDPRADIVGLLTDLRCCPMANVWWKVAAVERSCSENACAGGTLDCGGLTPPWDFGAAAVRLRTAFPPRGAKAASSRRTPRRCAHFHGFRVPVSRRA